MEKYISLFVSNGKGFFKEQACINCSIDCYCACDGADVLFDIDGVMRKKLIDVGQGVKITEPIKVEKELLTGEFIYASLSHQGILGIYVNRNIVQFTDLSDNKQVEIDVEGWTLPGFYDSSVLLLTSGEHLREATVKEVFDNPTIEIFEEIEETNKVVPFVDVSLLHTRRNLYYPTEDYKLFSFNVDTRINKEIEVGKNVWALTSFTGIDCRMKVVFQDWDDEYTYSLNTDDTVTKVIGRQDG